MVLLVDNTLISSDRSMFQAWTAQRSSLSLQRNQCNSSTYSNTKNEPSGVDHTAKALAFISIAILIVL